MSFLISVVSVPGVSVIAFARASRPSLDLSLVLTSIIAGLILTLGVTTLKATSKFDFISSIIKVNRKPIDAKHPLIVTVSKRPLFVKKIEMRSETIVPEIRTPVSMDEFKAIHTVKLAKNVNTTVFAFTQTPFDFRKILTIKI